MHWIGNDFVLLNMKDINSLDVNLNKEFVSRICNRNFWIWSDWLLILDKSKVADFKYVMYNPDWSIAEMCWNWIRCFMKYLIEEKITSEKSASVETWAWILHLEMDADLVKVDMWSPKLTKWDIWIPDDKEVNWTIFSKNREFSYTSVSMWNPHCVIFVDEKVKDFEINKYWAPIEANTEYFKNKVNVEFIELISNSEINFRVYERWAWETLACWTWACASVVAWIMNWKLKKNTDIKVNLAWWTLYISWSWNTEESVIMTWNAETSFIWYYYI